ncbi:MAG: peptidylprolyl isomerase, partial [Spirochaetaceae bacterium]|nr:peptidylprolyl isomerase [Spirochaetaceae bacterium]
MAKAKKREQETGAEELFRRLKSNPPLFIGTVLVLVLVIVAFVFVPALPDFGTDGTGNDYIFGYYGDIPISYLPDNYFGRNLERLSRMYGVSLESDYSKDFDTNRMANMVWQETFYMTLAHEAILDETKNAGYKAPTVQIDREMTKLPDFLENGRFSITKYRSYSRNMLLSIWKTTEEDYTEQQYKNAYNSLLVSSGEKKLIEDMSSPERTFRMALFPRTSYPDAEVALYGASNPAPFRMVHLSKIVISSSEKEARQIRDSILDGRTNFEDAARTQSSDASSKDQGGDMGVRIAYDIYSMIPDEAERTAVLSLKNGEYSEVVKDPNGWA